VGAPVPPLLNSNENAFAVLEADGSITMWGWGGADDEASSVEPSALRAAKAVPVE
jgi:hypothetical protein